MLELIGLYKTFNPGTVNEKRAINGLNLTLEDGDFVTIIGGNGAGKSTTLNLIAGAIPADQGTIRLDGVDLTRLPEHKRAKYLGRVFQDPMMGTAATMQIEENKGVQEQLEEQHKALVEIQQQNESLKQENETLQNNIDKYSFTLNEKSNELNRLEILTKENQRLRDRETYLSNLLIKDIRDIKNLKDKKSPINILQWDEIKKNIDLLFDNYTIRLSQVIPSMTESDLQVCCLIKLRFSNLDIADILNISPTSVSKRKFRLKERIIQKLGSLGESHTLDLWLLEF